MPDSRLSSSANWVNRMGCRFQFVRRPANGWISENWGDDPGPKHAGMPWHACEFRPGTRRLPNAARFQFAQFSTPFPPLFVGNLGVGEKTASSAVDQRLQGLKTSGLLDGRRDMI